MPEDIPEPAVRLTEEEVGMRASDWSDFRRDYGSHDDAVRKREHAAFCAGWDARHTSAYLTPAQQAAIERVKHMIEANSHVTASITEALYTDAADRAEVESLERLDPRRRADVEAVREKMAEEREPTHFAPYGSRDAACGVTVRTPVAWDINEGDYIDVDFTTRRALTTCEACLAVFAKNAGPTQMKPGTYLFSDLPRTDPIEDGFDSAADAAARPRTRREAREAATREKGDALAKLAGAGQVTVADLARAATAANGSVSLDAFYCQERREIDGRACILMPEHGGDHDYSRIPKRPIRDEPQA